MTLSLCLAGAAPDTGNNGVTALCHSVLQAFDLRLSGCQFTVFGYNRGVFCARCPGTEQTIEFQQTGAYRTRRYYRPESLWQISWLSRIPSLRKHNSTLRAYSSASALLDIAGGDSFSDLYGIARFNEIMAFKQLALRLKIPLILLPQTYGPYSAPACRKRAAAAVAAASCAWARDEDSFAAMRALLGSRFNPEIHRLGVDMAFGLIPQEPVLSEELVRFLQPDPENTPIAGLNLSGLLFCQQRLSEPSLTKANDRKGLYPELGCNDYLRSVVMVATKILKDGAKLLLVPHVYAPTGHGECDMDACHWLAEQLPQYAHLIRILPAAFTPGEIKGVLRRLDWFCGTRMHSTIAALSSGVPAAAIAYSGKTAGVFACCGLRDCVADARSDDAETVAETVLQSWRERVRLRGVLAEHLPNVMATHTRQIDGIVKMILSLPCRKSDA